MNSNQINNFKSHIVGGLKAVVKTLSLVLVFTNLAYAGDAATIIFKSGQVVKVDDGYRAIVDAMKGQAGSTDSKLVELNLNGGNILLNLAEVVVLCRDRCDAVKIQHQLDPKRQSTEVRVENPR